MDREEKLKAIENHVKSIMELLEIENTPSTEGTPKRIAKMYMDEVFKNVNDKNLDELDAKMKTFPNEQRGFSELIIFKKIHFHSMCEHHFMPFEGDMYVAYIPSDRIIGLSKVPRVVEYFSKRPQLQERLVNDVADYLKDLLKPQLLYVLATDVKHTCVTARGVETYCEVETLATRVGDIEDPEHIIEFKRQFYSRIGR